MARRTNRAFSWQDAEIRLNGKRYPCRAMEHTTERPSENIHVNDAEPYEYTVGLKNYSGNLSILQSTLYELEDDYPQVNSITDIVFDVAVSFVSGDLIRTKLWKDVRVTEVTESMGVDDEFMEVELPVAIGRIQRIF